MEKKGGVCICQHLLFDATAVEATIEILKIGFLTFYEVAS